MAPTTQQHTESEQRGDTFDDDDDGNTVNVALTGFGVFSTYVDNPSWLCVKRLHDERLDLSLPPRPGSAHPPGTSSPCAHLHCIQMPVVYSAVLDTIPRLHGAHTPASPYASPWLDPRGDQHGFAGDGRPYPAGYVGAPRRPDVVVHVGVGRPGGIALERRAHRTGYRLRDSAGRAAPPLAQTRTAGVQSETDTERFERLRAEGTAGAVPHEQTELSGGFGEGYEGFADEEVSLVDVEKLQLWLRSQGVEDTRISDDAGRFLCDFIYYASLCESRRARNGGATHPPPIPVIFIHVPPIGAPLSLDQMVDAIRAAVWWIARDVLSRRTAGGQ